MNVTLHTDIQTFLLKTLPSLRKDEAANNLMLGIALRLEKDPQAYSAEPILMATVEQDGALAAAALMTPPFNLLLHCAVENCEQTWPPLIAALRQAGWVVPGVVARVEDALPFSAAWQEATGELFHTAMEMRTFKLEEVTPPTDVPGRMRPAVPGDLQTVFPWWIAFNREAVPHDPLPDEEKTLQRIEKGDIYLWVDARRPVSMAATTRASGKGISIGLVYTPPELRRQGYASALVAALSQYLLDAGFEYCTLFTDLANPTSNAIYQRIGYRAVCDYAMVVFGE